MKPPALCTFDCDLRSRYSHYERNRGCTHRCFNARCAGVLLQGTERSVCIRLVRWLNHRDQPGNASCSSKSCPSISTRSNMLIVFLASDPFVVSASSTKEVLHAIHNHSTHHRFPTKCLRHSVRYHSIQLCVCPTQYFTLPPKHRYLVTPSQQQRRSCFEEVAEDCETCLDHRKNTNFSHSTNTPLSDILPWQHDDRNLPCDSRRRLSRLSSPLRQM